MSDLDFFAVPPAGGSSVVSASARPPRPSRRRSVLLVAGLLSLVAALIAGLVLVRPQAGDNRPVVLPDTFAGFEVDDGPHFGEDPQWRKNMAEAFDGKPSDGRVYGSVRAGAAMNVVVVRGDSRGDWDLKFGHPPYTKIGQVSCTRTLSFRPEDDPHRSEKMLLCWRASKTLTVSMLALICPPDFEQTAARAVDEVWALQE